MYTLLLQRVLSKRSGDAKIKSQVDYILRRGMTGNRGKTWEARPHRLPPIQQDSGNWVFKYRIDFEKKRGQHGTDAEYKQWEEIKAIIQQTGVIQRFQPFPWTISGQNSSFVRNERNEDDVADRPLPPPENFNGVVADLNNVVLTQILGEVRTVQPFGHTKRWDQLKVPSELLGRESDKHLAKHPAWKNLYGVNPQIRVVLSNIKRAQETNGESRNHAVLFGHAGCGKTTTMFALENMFGSDAVLKLDATSTTRAGLEKLFFSELNEIPPLVFMEEAEKADPEALKIWLGALDDRGEIRKVNFKVNQLRQIKVLFVCTVNNKTLFDKMMGSDGSEAGALSSRCVTQLYYPRPNQTILLQILAKEIKEKGGNEKWIIPAIELAQKMNITDPRVVRSFLAGGDRLLDGSYQRDWQQIHQARQSFNNKN
jgi:hypothetical protein